MRQSRMCVTRASLEVAVMCSGETGSYCLCHIHRQKASGEDNSVYTRGVCFLFSVANPFCCDLSPSLWLQQGPCSWVQKEFVQRVSLPVHPATEPRFFLILKGRK